jgi:hypothetical protein
MTLAQNTAKTDKGKLKRFKIAGSVTGRIALWPKEVVTVRLTDAARDQVKPNSGAKDYKLQDVASFDRPKLDGTFEFRDLKPGVYHLTVFQTCPDNKQNTVLISNEVSITVTDSDVAETTLQLRNRPSLSTKVLPLGVSIPTPCGTAKRQAVKPAPTAGPGSTVNVRLQPSPALPAALRPPGPGTPAQMNIAFSLSISESRQLTSGLVMESRALIEQARVKRATTFTRTETFEVNGVSPGTYLLEVLELQPGPCGTISEISAGSMFIAVGARDLTVELPFALPFRPQGGGRGGPPCGLGPRAVGSVPSRG